jgi:ribA/ribD-fused uncharacterized protein
MKITSTHVYFYGGIFSNWCSCEYHDPLADLAFYNTEQNFMYYKAVVFHDLVTAAKIVKEKNPAEVKKYGRQVRNYNDKAWQALRYGYMVYVNYLKFSQNEELKKELLYTVDKILVEASPTDLVWGIGLAENDPSITDENMWRGTNLLGKALMEVRNMILYG